jgi:hypothetical protein
VAELEFAEGKKGGEVMIRLCFHIEIELFGPSHQ